MPLIYKSKISGDEHKHVSIAYTRQTLDSLISGGHVSPDDPRFRAAMNALARGQYMQASILINDMRKGIKGVE
jgi:hypothetical protein